MILIQHFWHKTCVTIFIILVSSIGVFMLHLLFYNLDKPLKSEDFHIK